MKKEKVKPDLYWSDLVPEAGVSVRGRIYTARCGNVTKVNSEPSWQVFMDGRLTPAGYIHGHRCPQRGGERRFLVYDGNALPLFEATGDSDRCVAHYTECLAAIDAELPRGDDE